MTGRKGEPAPNAHKPNDSTRRQVAGMAAANVSMDKIALAIGISINTLYRCYGQQIKEAKAQAEALVAQNLFNKATKGNGSDALKAAALWYAKAKEEERQLPRKQTGRPSTFNQEIADKVCQHIARGGYATDTQRFGLPSITTINKWANEIPAFAAAYARAREARAEHFAEEMVEIADTASDPVKARLQVETRKWIASKLFPRMYGENQRVEVEHTLSETAARVLADLAQRQKERKRLEAQCIDVTPLHGTASDAQATDKSSSDD